MYLGITFKEATTSNSLAPTGRRLQPPSFSGYNLREAPTSQLSRYNQKEDTTPYVLRLQLEGGYNHLVLRLQPKGRSNSLILWHQLEGGYNPIFFPRPVALKYKCQMMKLLPHCPYEIYHYKHVPICVYNL
jgi:hypothetical protein